METKSPVTPETLDLLQARLERAETMLRAAIALFSAHFLSEAVASRLRERPRFTERMPKVALCALRARIEAESVTVVDALDLPLSDLRAHMDAVEYEDEARTFAEVIAEHVGPAAERILSTYFFPSDARPDSDDDVDLSPHYELRAAPAPSLMWAWAEVRALDQLRSEIEDGLSPEADLTLRLQLPEALPDDEQESE